MQYTLKKKPKDVVLIEGFPGFGLVGTITTEFLVNQLDTELIGYIRVEELPALIAVHEGKLVEPMGIYYAKKQNIVILHIMTNIAGFEWKVSEMMIKIAKELDVKEIISVEGVGSSVPTENPTAFFHANNAKGRARMKKVKVKPLNEGIILGATATLLMQAEKTPITCIFAETHSNLPDSKASAKVIEVLDKYLNLKVDYAPLLKQAEKFEAKIKGLIQKGNALSSEHKKKQLSYLG